MRTPPLSSIQTAVTMYYEKPQLSRQDIKMLFKCGDNKAGEMKQVARNKMQELGVPVWNERRVDTETAFLAWGLDIAKMEKSLKKLAQIKGGIEWMS